MNADELCICGHEFKTHEGGCLNCNCRVFHQRYTELALLMEIIKDEVQYQHWENAKTGRDALIQVAKWINKIRCREVIRVGKFDLVARS